MAIPDSHLIAVFVSTHETLRAERHFKEHRIKVKATVKPRSITSNCQMAITFAADDRGRIEAVVAEEGLDLTGMYRKDDSGDWVAVE